MWCILGKMYTEMLDLFAFWGGVGSERQLACGWVYQIEHNGEGAHRWNASLLDS